jgi:hypothetical protein
LVASFNLKQGHNTSAPHLYVRKGQHKDYDALGRIPICHIHLRRWSWPMPMAFERRGADLGIPVLRRTGGDREVLVRPTSGHRPQRAGAFATPAAASRGLTVWCDLRQSGHRCKPAKLDQADKILTSHIEASSFPNNDGIDQWRVIVSLVETRQVESTAKCRKRWAGCGTNVNSQRRRTREPDSGAVSTMGRPRDPVGRRAERRWRSRRRNGHYDHSVLTLAPKDEDLHVEGQRQEEAEGR